MKSEKQLQAERDKVKQKRDQDRAARDRAFKAAAKRTRREKP
jgi:hypothetical protein